MKKGVLLVLSSLLVSEGLWGQVVLLPEGLAEKAAAVVAENPSLELLTYRNGEEALEKVGEAEAYIGTPTEELLAKGEKLRWVHIFSAGIEKQRDLPGFLDGRYAVTNLKIYQGPEIADHAFALLLGLTRNMAAYHQAQQEGEWTRGADAVLPLVELRGKTMLILGYGGIGTQVGERAKAFGMTVHALDEKDVPLTMAVERFGKPDELEAFLPLADVVVSCLPITPETDLLLGKEQFEKMKKGAYFINVSRGRVADTEALIQALESGHLAGAGLDVVDPEPLPKESPLWKMPQVIITPHVAGVSDERGGRSDALILDNLGRFAKKLPLKNLTEPAKGY